MMGGDEIVRFMCVRVYVRMVSPNGRNELSQSRVDESGQPCDFRRVVHHTCSV